MRCVLCVYPFSTGAVALGVPRRTRHDSSSPWACNGTCLCQRSWNAPAGLTRHWASSRAPTFSTSLPQCTRMSTRSRTQASMPLFRLRMDGCIRRRKCTQMQPPPPCNGPSQPSRLSMRPSCNCPRIRQARPLCTNCARHHPRRTKRPAAYLPFYPLCAHIPHETWTRSATHPSCPYRAVVICHRLRATSPALAMRHPSTRPCLHTSTLGLQRPCFSARVVCRTSPAHRSWWTC